MAADPMGALEQYNTHERLRQACTVTGWAIIGETEQSAIDNRVDWLTMMWRLAGEAMLDRDTAAQMVQGAWWRWAGGR